MEEDLHLLKFNKVFCQQQFDRNEGLVRYSTYDFQMVINAKLKVSVSESQPFRCKKR